MTLKSYSLIICLCVFSLIGCTNKEDRKAKLNKQAAFEHLMNAYTVSMEFWAETGRLPQSLDEAKFKPTSSEVTVKYKATEQGFLITSSSGDFEMSIDNKKNLFDKDLKPTSVP